MAITNPTIEANLQAMRDRSAAWHEELARNREAQRTERRADREARFASTTSTVRATEDVPAATDLLAGVTANIKAMQADAQARAAKTQAAFDRSIAEVRGAADSFKEEASRILDADALLEPFERAYSESRSAVVNSLAAEAERLAQEYEAAERSSPEARESVRMRGRQLAMSTLQQNLSGQLAELYRKHAGDVLNVKLAAGQAQVQVSGQYLQAIQGIATQVGNFLLQTDQAAANNWQAGLQAAMGVATAYANLEQMERDYNLREQAMDVSESASRPASVAAPQPARTQSAASQLYGVYQSDVSFRTQNNMFVPTFDFWAARVARAL